MGSTSWRNCRGRLVGHPAFRNTGTRLRATAFSDQVRSVETGVPSTVMMWSAAADALVVAHAGNGGPDGADFLFCLVLHLYEALGSGD